MWTDDREHAWGFPRVPVNTGFDVPKIGDTFEYPGEVAPGWFTRETEDGLFGVTEDGDTIAVSMSSTCDGLVLRYGGERDGFSMIIAARLPGGRRAWRIQRGRGDDS